MIASFVVSRGQQHFNLASLTPQALSYDNKIEKVNLSDLVSRDSKLLRAGDPTKRAIVVFYDSRVGTHNEYMNILEIRQVFKRARNFDILLVDLAKQ